MGHKESTQPSLFAEMDEPLPKFLHGRNQEQLAAAPPPSPPIADTESNWIEFIVKHGRVPMIQDKRKPWTYRGWLLYYRWMAEANLDISPRWDYWQRTMEAGKLLDEPIPQLKFSDHASDRSEGFKMLDRCISIIENHCSSPMFDLLSWLQFGLAIGKEQKVKIDDKMSEQLYRTFNLQPWLEEPYDYIGLWISEHKSKRWNSTGFFPTPHNVVEMMCRMMFGESDMRRETVNDPCVGTGRFLLHASNFSLRLTGVDIDGTVLAGCLVNGAIYAPWLVRPFPEEWFA